VACRASSTAGSRPAVTRKRVNCTMLIGSSGSGSGWRGISQRWWPH
jgi:hypothetical protein